MDNRRKRPVASVALAFLSSAGVLAFALPAAAAPRAPVAARVAAPGTLTYVALGDSYSSGEGVKPFFERGPCHRSTKAYATQVVLPGTDTTWYSQRSSPGHGWGFLACSGATIDDVVTSQIDKPEKKGNDNYLELGAGTRLVTITVGATTSAFPTSSGSAPSGTPPAPTTLLASSGPSTSGSARG